MATAILIVLAILQFAAMFWLWWSFALESRSVRLDADRVRSEDRRAYESEMGLVRGRLALLENPPKPVQTKAEPVARRPRGVSMSELREAAERESRIEAGE